jgi:hypothetical protein
MRIERGCFERPSYRLFEAARCRVVVEPADFKRLELREFECGTHLSPCLAWCHETIGQSHVRWEMDATGAADVFYFTQLHEAEVFYHRFAPTQAQQNELQLAA